MLNFIALFKKLFAGKSNEPAPIVQEDSMTKEKIAQLMQQMGIDPQFEQFKTEAYHLSTMILREKMPVNQALQTVKDIKLRDELRPFIYATFLSGIVAGVQYIGAITPEQSEDLCAYLSSPWMS